jgi:serine/threonine protein kinase
MDYGAPEQFEDAKRVDCGCDLYSLAGSLYTALTGKFPFGYGNHLQIMQRKLLKQYVPLRLLLPSLDPTIDQLVDRCFAPNPGQRPRSCDEFIAVLRDSKPGSEIESIEDQMFCSSDTGVTGPERRASVRFEVDLTTTFVPFHQKMRGRWQSTILDVSLTGVRMRTSRPVAVHSVLQITLGGAASPELGTTCSQLALVRWVKAVEGDIQIVGCSFVRPLTEHQLDTLRRAIG